MKTSKVFLNLTAFFMYVYGAIYLFSLVFIPIGIYCFIGAKKFASKADNINDYYNLDRNVFRNYVIFASIFCFPFGLMSIIPYVKLATNNVKVKTEETDKPEFIESENNDIKINDISDNETNKVTNAEDVEKVETVEMHEESEDEKIEKFKKLQSFKEKGLITDDELEMAREQLFGKKEK